MAQTHSMIWSNGKDRRLANAQCVVFNVYVSIRPIKVGENVIDSGLSIDNGVVNHVIIDTRILDCYVGVSNDIAVDCFPRRPQYAVSGAIEYMVGYH
jgi:hypothetical protein